MSRHPLLEIDHLFVRGQSSAGEAEILRDVSLTVYPGQIVGLVGESGSGKSTLTATVLDNLGRNREVVKGTIRFRDRLVYGSGTDERASLRGKEVGCVFQAAAASLNPLRRVGSQLGELLELYHGTRGRDATKRMLELLASLGLHEPEAILRHYPHQLSGGMAQRVAIAMGLAGLPSLLIADECTSALDVTTQQTVVTLLKRLSVENGRAMLFVTHDIALAADICDNVVVLRDGAIVDAGPLEQLVRNPSSRYTRNLIDAVPILGRAKSEGAAVLHHLDSAS